MLQNCIWQKYPKQPEVTKKISDIIGIPQVISQLVLNRSVKNISEVEHFIKRSWDDWVPLPNQEQLISIIKELANKKASVCIYGDYDADGVTSTAMMVDILRHLNCRVDFISPHRINDGYGLNNHRVEEIARKKYDALITLDCGITNQKEISHLKSLHPTIKIIIIDHHKCPSELPDVDAIVNPQLANNDHPAYFLCTVALIDYIFRTTAIDGVNIDDYIDLVAIGLIADVMPLKGLNRWYVYRGLSAIKKSPRKSILDLCVLSLINHQEITARDIAFGIAPKLNAAGRLGDPTPVVQTLIEKDPEKIKELTGNLDKMNKKRQKIGSEIQHDIDQQLAKKNIKNNERGIICSGQFWHTGIIGINAAKLVNTYHKPAIVIGFDYDIARGSARSVPGVNIYNIIDKCANTLDHFGGHSQAAGFSLNPANIVEFKQQFMSACSEMINHNDLIKRINIDDNIQLADVTLDFIDQINQLEPFGEGNPEPVFIANVRLIDVKKVGKSKAHIKCRFEQNGTVIDAIGFGLAEKVSIIKSQIVDIVFSVSKNNYNGIITPQLNLIDMK